MQISITKLPKSTAELTVEISTDEFSSFLDKAAEKISQEKKIPGFRPGKVPFHILVQEIGQMPIWQEAAEIAVRETYSKAVLEKELETVAQPKIEIQKLAPNNPFVYKATAVLLPEVKLADYQKIKVKKNQIKIAEIDIEKTLEDLQKGQARETLVDRASRQGDKLIIDLEIFQNKVPLKNGKTKNFSLVIGQDWLTPGLSENLAGLKKDEEKEFELKIPEKHFDKNLAGRRVDFKVKVNSVYEIDLPEIDDKFAQNLGNFKTLADLKEQLKKNLEKEAAVEEGERLEQEILKNLVEKSEFEEMPEILIDHEKEKMLIELEATLTRQNLKFEDYLSHIKKTRDQLKEEFTPGARERIKTALVLRAIAKKEKMRVPDSDVEKEQNMTLELYKDKPEVQEKVRSEAYKNYLKNVLTTRRVIDYLKNLCV